MEINKINYIFKAIICTLILVLMGAVSTYAASEDVITSGTGVEASTETTTGVEFTEETTQLVEGATVVENTTENTTKPTTEATTETTTETTTKIITEATTETTTVTTPVKPPTHSGGGSGSGSGSGSSKSCRVTFQSGDKGKIIRGQLSLSAVIAKGTKPKNIPNVIPDAGYVFIGWSKNGVTITNPQKVPLYSNTVYTAVYKEKSGIDKFLDIGGILDKLGF